MASLGTGWIDGAWVEVGWIAAAWDDVANDPQAAIGDGWIAGAWKTAGWITASAPGGAWRVGVSMIPPWLKKRRLASGQI